MNEEIQARLVLILDWVEQSALTASEFAVEQVPDVIQQLLMWKFAISFIPFLVGVLLLIALIGICPLLIRWCIKKTSELNEYYQGVQFLPFVPVLLVLLLSSLLIAKNFTWLQIWIAPKVYLLEYAANLLP